MEQEIIKLLKDKKNTSLTSIEINDYLNLNTIEEYSELENTLDRFSKENYSAPYNVKGYDHFDDRVIFMKVFMSEEGIAYEKSILNKYKIKRYALFDAYRFKIVKRKRLTIT